MSNNKGKDAELDALILLSNIGKAKNNVDVTRPSVTNSADLGVDMTLHHPKEFLDEIAKNSNAIYYKGHEQNKKNTENKQMVTRFDIKNTNNKLQKPLVEKFLGDVKKNPDCEGHVLMGGKGLTGPAKKVLDSSGESLSQAGKSIMYIDNDGVGKLKKKYGLQNDNSKKTNKKKIEDKEDGKVDS